MKSGSGRPVSTIVRLLQPMPVGMIAVLFLITYWPALVTFLPRLVLSQH